MTATTTILKQQTYTMVIERCLDASGYYAYIPGWPGAHSEADNLEELRSNMHEVIAMLLEDGPPELDSEFYGTETIRVS